MVITNKKGDTLQTNDDVVVTETYKNKCLFCNRVIGDGVSNYHIGCYKQKTLLDEKEEEDKLNGGCCNE